MIENKKVPKTGLTVETRTSVKKHTEVITGADVFIPIALARGIMEETDIATSVSSDSTWSFSEADAKALLMAKDLLRAIAKKVLYTGDTESMEETLKALFFKSNNDKEV
jgi:hypothetical protein